MNRSQLFKTTAIATAVLFASACDPDPSPGAHAETATDSGGSAESGAAEDTGAATNEDPTTEEQPVVEDEAGIAGFAAFVGPDGDTTIERFSAAELPDNFAHRGPQDLVAAADTTASPYYIPEPPGFGHYCSMTWTTGGWAMAWSTDKGDPCQYLRDEFGTTGRVKRAGMFHASGTNQTSMWCNGTAWGPAIYRGSGTAALSATFDAAVASGESSCVMAVSPFYLPIFTRGPGSFTSTGTGVDFARDGSPTLHTGWFGATGSDLNPLASYVNMAGQSRGAHFVDDHDGWDWNASEGTSLYAMGNGYVISTRDYQTSAVACANATEAATTPLMCINRDYPVGGGVTYRNAGWDGSDQGEVYIRHQVQTDPWEYRESFVVGYFHVKRTLTPAKWSTVESGDVIAQVGNGGWTTGPHLHMTVIRESNVGRPTNPNKFRWFSPNADSCTTCPGGSHEFHQYAVDPYGWQSAEGVDPRGWTVTDGAMSPRLWGYDFWTLVSLPSTGSWGP